MVEEQEVGLEKRILDVAEKLFLEKGFAMTSTTEIARQAGCNQALIHYYFRTKENLFQSIFEQKIRLLMSTFEERETGSLSFEERLKIKIEAHFDMVRANPRLPFLVVNEFTTNPSRIDAFRQKVHQLPSRIWQSLEDELQQEIKAGRIRPIALIDIVFTIVSLNAMLFLASPIFKNVAQVSDSAYETMIDHRRQEHVKVILGSLRP